MTRRRLARGARGFTFVELMVVLAVLGVMASIFLPYVERARESDRRVRCYENLVRLSAALRDYAAANGHYYPATRSNPRAAGYTCFTGPDDPAPFVATSAVQPNDVTASLWLLVRLDLAGPRDFICPSTDDTPDPLRDAGAARRGNFRSADHLSYSYASPFSTAPGYRLNDTRPPEFALLADRNPGPAAAGPACDAGPFELSVANSSNHTGRGRTSSTPTGTSSSAPRRTAAGRGTTSTPRWAGVPVRHPRPVRPRCLPGRAAGPSMPAGSPVGTWHPPGKPTVTWCPRPPTAGKPAGPKTRLLQASGNPRAAARVLRNYRGALSLWGSIGYEAVFPVAQSGRIGYRCRRGWAMRKRD